MKRAMVTVLPLSFILACSGPEGLDGMKGDKGAMGDMGAMGAKGDKGNNGAEGAKGDTGAPGTNGQDGQNGANGQDGQAGAAGRHCWDVNQNGECDMNPEGVNEDVDGNEDCDVFDCRGEDGAAGQTGERGERGEKGDRGDPGATGAPGADGAKGDKGDKGDRGDPGTDGTPGRNGERGEKGDKGDRGDTGPQGTFTAGACTFRTGVLVAGTNAHGGFDTSTVTCPAPAFAVGIFPVQQAWSASATCQPISFRIDNRTVGTDWFSQPRDIGTGCESNSFATATLCCQ
jgi:hypothetical protein